MVVIVCDVMFLLCLVKFRCLVVVVLMLMWLGVSFSRLVICVVMVVWCGLILGVLYMIVRLMKLIWLFFVVIRLVVWIRNCVELVFFYCGLLGGKCVLILFVVMVLSSVLVSVWSVILVLLCFDKFLLCGISILLSYSFLFLIRWWMLNFIVVWVL